MKQQTATPNGQRGQNILQEGRRKSRAESFLEQLNDPLIFILFIAAAISMLLGEVSDTAIILAVILVNSIVGVVQEGKAQKALESLKQMTSPSRGISCLEISSAWTPDARYRLIWSSHPSTASRSRKPR